MIPRSFSATTFTIKNCTRGDMAITASMLKTARWVLLYSVRAAPAGSYMSASEWKNMEGDRRNEDAKVKM